MPIDDFEMIYRCEKEANVKEIVPAAILGYADIQNNNFEIAKSLVKINFKDFRYLFDALFANKAINGALKIKNALTSYGVDVNYEFICAVIAYIDELRRHLNTFIKETSNEFLIDYFIKNKIFGFNAAFVNYIVSSNNPKLKKYLEESLLTIPIGVIIFSNLDNELKRKAIENEIQTNINNKEQLYLIFDLLAKCEDKTLRRIINEIIINLQDIEDLCEYANRLKGGIAANIMGILEQIPDSPFKDKLLDVLYDHESYWGNLMLHKGSYFNNSSGHNFSILELGTSVSELNPFEASYISKKLNDHSNLLPFVREHYRSRLDWIHLTELSKKLKPEEQNEFYKYFYLGNRELFFKTAPRFNNNFALNIINEYPASVIDFLRYLFGEEIISLPESTLDIFVKHYEEKVNNEDVTLSDKLHNTLSKRVSHYEDAGDIVEFLTYIMAKGIINNEILMYAKTISFASNLNPLFIKAVSNTKTPYLRASFAPKLYSLNANNWNIIFLTTKEKEDILNGEENADAKDLKFRKYYGDLLKLIPSVPENIKYRITVEIAKSKIENILII